jgi:hypothetical protein
MQKHPTTPAGRYFVVDGQLWRCSNPSLSDQERQRFVSELMDARREVRRAKSSNAASQLKQGPRSMTRKWQWGRVVHLGGLMAARITTVKR